MDEYWNAIIKESYQDMEKCGMKRKPSQMLLASAMQKGEGRYKITYDQDVGFTMRNMINGNVNIQER